MNGSRTLRDLLVEASGHGELSTRQLEMKVDAAREKGYLKSRLNRVTIANIMNGSYKSRPTDDTIRAIAYLAGVDDTVAFTAAGRRSPGRPFADDLPDGVDDLTPKEREAAVYILRTLVNQRRELNRLEDQSEHESTSPLADGETRPHGAPMIRAVPNTEPNEELPSTAGNLDDPSGSAQRADPIELLPDTDEPLPYEPPALHAARDIAGPTEGELRRRDQEPGAEAGDHDGPEEGV